MSGLPVCSLLLTDIPRLQRLVAGSEMSRVACCGRPQAWGSSRHAPLSDDIRSALMSLLQMRWGEPQSEVTQEDWAEYQRLCQPESPDFILNILDYYAFFTYSMFRGKVAK